MDISKKDKQRVDNLVRNHFLNSNKIIQLNDFITANEADIEDLFSVDEYLALVKSTYPDSTTNLAVESLNNQPRIIKRLESYFLENASDTTFNHFLPSRIGLSELGNNINISQETIDRFESVFKKLNSLLFAE
ncbi:conserved hypothetical protein [methanotrophic bacterial endosymbiont of Bathymodiolus sp.]|nr:conserved hypothetical protein [methanotrophic bacterial endosymbiont of Bathymodiolus sp.]